MVNAIQKKLWHGTMLLWALSACMAASLTFAGTDDKTIHEQLFSMSLEELMDVPVITSASRMAQKGTQLSAAVTIITAEDIHYSGLTSIPEILQFAAGVDSRRLDRIRHIVGVHGLHGTVSDRTLILIDGRAADNPVFGSMDWLGYPVFIEDIERIEIVRGPSSASWGANALTGVINIITKKPEKVPGLFTSTTWTEYGDSYTHLRLGGSEGKWAWRISAGYESIEDSDSAGAGKFKSFFPALNGLLGFDGYRARDFGRTWRFDSEFNYRPSEQTTWSFGIGHSSAQTGDREWVGFFPQKDYHTDLTRLFARMDHTCDNGSSAYLQWFGNFLFSKAPNLLEKYSFAENDFEGQYNFAISDSHTLSAGGNVRLTRVETTNGQTAGETVFHGDPFNERWIGLFVIDRLGITEKLTIENQIRRDFYSGTHDDWSIRSSAFYSLDQNEQHVLRLSYARAFRTPVVGFRKSTSSTVYGLFNTLMPAEDMKNEKTWAIEGGYTGLLTKNLSLSVNTYYQRFDDFIGTYNSTIGPVTNSIFANTDGADSYGADCQLSAKSRQGSLSLWYAYNHFHTDHKYESIRSLFPSEHKAGLTGRLFLENNWVFNTNYAYHQSIDQRGTLTGFTKQLVRLDVSLTKKFAGGRGELMVGVSDIFSQARRPAYDIMELTSYYTPGRTFFARIQYLF